MKKQLKTKISSKPVETLGFTLDEYLLWCNKHQLIPYKIDNKRKFCKLVNTFVIVKRNNKFLENGEEIK